MWVKHGESGESKRFALVGGSKLPVRAIAAYWKLEPSSLCVGEDDVLAMDESSGNSLADARSIMEMARSLGLGDGSSRSGALPITGKPASSELLVGNAQSKGKHKDAKLLHLLRRQVQDNERRARKRERDAAEQKRCMDEKRRLFFKRGAMHAYTFHMATKVVDKMAPADVILELQRGVCSGANPIIGWLHAVATSGESDRRGMVTLVSPSGRCVTSSNCMGDGERYVVHLGGKVYECSGRCSGGVGILEPLPGSEQGFSVCAPVCTVWGKYSDAYSAFAWSGEEEFRLVEGLNMGYDGLRYVMFAQQSVDIPLGSPVLAYEGGLSGVVVGVEKLPQGPRSGRHIDAFPATIADLEALIAAMSKPLGERMRKCATANTLVYFTSVGGKFETPISQWQSQNVLALLPLGSSFC